MILFGSFYLGLSLEVGSWFSWNRSGRNQRRAKSFLPGQAATFQRLLNGMNDGFPDCCRIAKTHFAFCRVNIYIDSCGIEFQKEKGNRILAFHQSGMITLADSCCEKPAFNGTAVYKNELLRPGLSTQSCLTYKSTYANISRRRAIYFNKALQ